MSAKNKVGFAATDRLKNDYIRLKREPIPLVHAEPDPSNILTWHYCLRGPLDTPYEGGYFHGLLKFPRDFPFKPPSILMLTPNGRFKVNQRLCLSISDFHPDTWNPAWSVSTILTGLCSFMVEESKTYGSIECDSLLRKRFARHSGMENLKDEKFKELFPDLVQEIKESIIEHKTKLESTLAKKGEKKSSEASKEATANANANDKNAPPIPAGGGASGGSLMTTILILFFALLAGIIFSKES